MAKPRIDHDDAISSNYGVTWILIAFAIFYGTMIIIGGEERWAAPAFKTALSVPGSPESWGAVLLALGVISIIGFTRFRGWGYSSREIKYGKYYFCGSFFLIGVWCLFFCISFAKEFFSNSSVSVTGTVAFLVFCALYMHFSVLYWRGRNA